VDAERELGTKLGTLVSLEAFFGATVSTYGSRTTYRKSTPEKRKEIFEKDLKRMEWDSPPLPYGEFLTPEQVKKVEAKVEEKKQGVVYEGMAPDVVREKRKSDETYLKALEDQRTARKTFSEMSEALGLTYKQAHKLLKDYHQDKGGVTIKNRPRYDKPGYESRVAALKEWYSANK
jgi:hypothetical protein